MEIKLDLGELKYNLMKIRVHYKSELNKENDNLNSYLKDLEKREEKKLKIDLYEVENNTKRYWKELILDAVHELLETIKNRKTKGSEFVEIKKDLEKTSEDLPYDDLDIETLRSIYEETLQRYRDRIKEKMEIEKYNNRRFWLGLLVGIFLGSISSFIISWYFWLK